MIGQRPSGTAARAGTTAKSPHACRAQSRAPYAALQKNDPHGQWRRDPVYGAVWLPQAMPADWVPYRHGHWDWIASWGWTWVDDAPWGFAPFHYGRWTMLDEQWAWVPGRLGVRPVYAPALVAFLGGGSMAPWTLTQKRRSASCGA